MFSIEIQPTPTPSLSPVPSQPPSALFLSVGSAAAPFAVGSSRRSLVTQKASRGRSFSSLSSPRHSLPLWFSPLLGRDGRLSFPPSPLCHSVSASHSGIENQRSFFIKLGQALLLTRPVESWI
ncbi:hypothetical protein ACOSQ3_024443 [Xanthoceras sorbifolium]